MRRTISIIIMILFSIVIIFLKRVISFVKIKSIKNNNLNMKILNEESTKENIFYKEINLYDEDKNEEICFKDIEYKDLI